MFVDSPTELTTAFTDAILALQALLAVVMLRRSAVQKHMWTSLWAWVFGLLCVSSMLGAIAHGVKMTDVIQDRIWTIVYLTLGVLMALFAITAISMMWGSRAALRCLPAGLLIAAIFFGITQLWSDSFLLFVVYEALSMILALVLYSAGFWLRREPGSPLLALGIIVGLLAAGVESQSYLKWSVAGYHFDNHGLFHLVQMISLALLTIGVYQSHSEQTRG